MEKNKKSSRKKVEIKKTLKAFLADEDGFVNKETILKIGLATVAGVGVFGAMSDISGHTNATHTNTVDYGTQKDAQGCPIYSAQHTNNTTTHSSY